jgi:hypothetical protein
MHRALSWFIDCPRDSSIDWNIDNTWAAGKGIISVEVNGKSIYHDNALCISNYCFDCIEGNNILRHVGLYWQLHLRFNKGTQL